MEIAINFDCIKDWVSFHGEFAAVMGFPIFYGVNMNAWIDCMTYIDDPSAGMSKVLVRKGETLDIVLQNVGRTDGERSEILVALVECIGSVNQRFIEGDTETRIRLTVT